MQTAAIAGVTVGFHHFRQRLARSGDRRRGAVLDEGVKVGHFLGRDLQQGRDHRRIGGEIVDPLAIHGPGLGEGETADRPLAHSRQRRDRDAAVTIEDDFLIDLV
nr:hypothetical protein [Paracoccus sp. S-4012]